VSAYLKFFELQQSPFDSRAQSKLVLGTRALRDAFAAISAGLDEGSSRVCVSGGRGLGKTTLARALPKLLGDRARVAIVPDPSVPWESLRQPIARQWGVASGGLARRALAQASRDRRLVLVIDQAERATEEFLDHLDVVLSYRSEQDEPIVQSVLLARLATDAEAGRAEPVPLLWWLDRIQTLQLTFEPLPRAGVESYVARHLARAGWQGGDLFTVGACHAIHEYTGGIPGEVSALCERLLDLAATEDLREIDEDFVRACCEPEADGSPSDVVDASEPDRAVEDATPARSPVRDAIADEGDPSTRPRASAADALAAAMVAEMMEEAAGARASATPVVDSPPNDEILLDDEVAARVDVPETTSSSPPRPAAPPKPDLRGVDPIAAAFARARTDGDATPVDVEEDADPHPASETLASARPAEPIPLRATDPREEVRDETDEDAALSELEAWLSAPPSPEELRAIRGSWLRRNLRPFLLAAAAAILGGVGLSLLAGDASDAPDTEGDVGRIAARSDAPPASDRAPAATPGIDPETGAPALFATPSPGEAPRMIVRLRGPVSERPPATPTPTTDSTPAPAREPSWAGTGGPGPAMAQRDTLPAPRTPLEALARSREGPLRRVEDLAPPASPAPGEYPGAAEARTTDTPDTF